MDSTKSELLTKKISFCVNFSDKKLLSFTAEQERKRKDARMKTVAYIYTLLVNVANKTITPEQALEMIRQLLSL